MAGIPGIRAAGGSSKGEKGDSGVKGERGTQGSKGERGERGLIGIKGERVRNVCISKWFHDFTNNHVHRVRVSKDHLGTKETQVS